MDRILILPDIRPAGYPAKPNAGYRISGQKSGKGRIPDIRQDTWFDKYIFSKISNKFVKKIIDFFKHQTKHDLVTKLIFVKKFFLALFEEELYKLLAQLNISRISGIQPYRISGRISGRAIWYPARYRISKKAGLSSRISGRPDIRCIPKYNIPLNIK
jgi:hypothetical protein